jgi:uncharacterized cupin superfamily protein
MIGAGPVAEIRVARGGVGIMKVDPIASVAVLVCTRRSVYPPRFAALVEGRTRRRLGDYFGLANFGVNLTELAPGAISALVHHHTKQDEFIYVLSGTPTLVLDDCEHLLRPGDCCGFKAGTAVGHHLTNHTPDPVVFLEIGDRTPGDMPTYPRDDLVIGQSADGSWFVGHKDGTPY